MLCGLITGGLNVASKSDSESALGAFVGGFNEGSISAIALVATTYLATLPKPTLNDYRDEERIKEDNNNDFLCKRNGIMLNLWHANVYKQR